MATEAPTAATATSPEALRTIFEARSVAVIGASDDPEVIGGRPVDYLRRHGFAGRVFPVNPKRDTVQGLKAYPSVGAIGEPVDLALIGLRADRVLDSLRECREAGVGGAVIFSSGYAETGPEGRARQQELAAFCAEHDFPVIGPNCVGFLVAEGGLTGTFMTPLKDGTPLTPGNVAILTQSGAMGTYLFTAVRAHHLGISVFANTGNEAVVDFAQCLDHLVDDPRTDIICGYIEGFHDGRRLIEAAARARDHGKTVILLKGGSSDVGQAAAASHTGLLSGPHEITSAAFRQAGIIEVASLEELIEVTVLAASGNWRSVRNVGILSITGGGGVMLADHCRQVGLDVPPFGPDTSAGLREVIPGFVSVGNPMDVSGLPLWKPEVIGRAVECAATDPAIDALLVSLIFGADPGIGTTWAADIIRISRGTDKPVGVVWLGPGEDGPAALREAGVPVFDSALRCARAMGALAAPGPVARAATAARTHGGGLLGEPDAKGWLRDAGIRVPRGEAVPDADAAVRAAHEIGYPVVLKVVADGVAHKSDIGGVRLGIGSDTEVRDACARIRDDVAGALPGTAIHGFLVEEMVGDGLDVVLAVRKDPQFGALLTVGIGGVFVELLGDVSIRVLPVGRDDVEDMLDGLRGAPLLAGARGGAPRDRAALVDAALRLADAFVSAPDIREVEINPLLVLPDGAGVYAADALIVKE